MKLNNIMSNRLNIALCLLVGMITSHASATEEVIKIKSVMVRLESSTSATPVIREKDLIVPLFLVKNGYPGQVSQSYKGELPLEDAVTQTHLNIIVSKSITPASFSDSGKVETNYSFWATLNGKRLGIVTTRERSLEGISVVQDGESVGAGRAAAKPVLYIDFAP
jgi:hypothetical protein